MPVVRTFPHRKHYRLRHADPQTYDDDHWEPYDPASLSPVKPEPQDAVPVVESESQVKPEPSESRASPVPPPRVPPRHVASDPRGHIPRPRNAFICFRSVFVKEKKDACENPESLDQTRLSCNAGEVWGSMTDAEKVPYQLMAVQEKEKHTLMYPTYSYSPKIKSAQGKAKKATTKRAEREGEDAAYREWVPGARKAARRSSVSKSKASRQRRKSTLLSSSGAAPAPEPVEEVASAPAPTPSPVPEPSVEPISEKKVSPIIHPSPVRPASYDKPPLQFKAHIPPTVIDNLTLARRSPSPLPSPYPSTSAFALPTLPPRRSASPATPRLPTPPPPRNYEAEWDAWVYAPLEFPDNTGELDFAPSPKDFGFYHPWEGAGSSDTPPVFRSLFEENLDFMAQ